MFIVGLTGGIGSGKSTVAKLFSKYTITVIDMDKIAREIAAPNTKLERKIIEHFGKSIVNEKGELDRKALGQKVFNNSDDRKWLESLLHPIIWNIAQKEAKQSTSEYVILVVPLLIESCSTKKVDRVLVVDVDQETQISRTRMRDNLSAEDVLAIMRTQVSREERLNYADDIVDNSKGLEKLEDSVSHLHKLYLKEAKNKSL